jgi:hypothetical protein
MSQRHLNPDLPAELRQAGLHVVVIDGWFDRGRPEDTGGFDPMGTLWHHTGSPDRVPQSERDDLEYANWLFKVGRSDLGPPLCGLSIGRDGTVYVGAGQRANHGGKARATGPMPAGDANALYAGVECQNSGTEGWSKAQYEAMVTTAAVLDKHGLPDREWGASHNRAHRETSVTGKWDPGGLDMDRFRADIAAKKLGRKVPKMGPVQKARIKFLAAIADIESGIEYLRDDAGPDRPVAFRQRIPARAAVNILKAVVSRLPAVKKG